ncbi:hypothetical protein [Pseudoalteromonas sp. S16_S37]|uniref:hypothetical protein n=1 Tax=Pseudoalteromonas sp. S16_S37 TaxID=2720228 RepID=UPI00168022E7|nr:hypothetical protein [Pseudoalteromonas sp. S16_S37]MBD1581579.1 hypothetical protein [Pseudoalteromonas sp. S16_S37]
MKKIVLIACSAAAAPAIECLVQMNVLAGVLITYCSESDAQQLAGITQHFGVPHASQAHIDNDVLASAKQNWQGDEFISYHLPYELLRNVQSEQDVVQVQVAQYSNATVEHALFQTIHSQQSHCVLSAVSIKHQQVLLSHSVAVESEDTAGTLHKKLLTQLPSLLQQLVSEFDSLYDAQSFVQFAPETLSSLDESHLFTNLQTDSAEQVIILTRAANPYFGGARLHIGKAVCQLMQVSLTEQPTFGVKAGTVVALSKSGGLIIALRNEQTLKLDVVSSAEGVFDGYRFAMQAKLQAGMNLK